MHRPHRDIVWARSCPTTRSRTSTRAHYGLSRGYRNRRAVTAGRARATTTSCKATQLLYGSSLGLGLWPLDQKPRLPVPTTCVAAPHTRLYDRRIEPCGSDAEAASSRCRTLRHSPRKYTTPPRRVKRAARVSACPHRYRLHCCDIAATAGARHITVAGRRPEGFRCGGSAAISQRRARVQRLRARALRSRGGLAAAERRGRVTWGAGGASGGEFRDCTDGQGWPLLY